MPARATERSARTMQQRQGPGTEKTTGCFVDDGWLPDVLLDVRIRRMMLQKQEEMKEELERLYGSEGPLTSSGASGATQLVRRCANVFSGVGIDIDHARVSDALKELSNRLLSLQETLAGVVENVNVDSLQEEEEKLRESERGMQAQLLRVQLELAGVRERLGPLRASDRLSKAERELLDFQESEPVGGVCNAAPSEPVREIAGKRAVRKRKADEADMQAGAEDASRDERNERRRQRDRERRQKKKQEELGATDPDNDAVANAETEAGRQGQDATPPRAPEDGSTQSSGSEDEAAFEP